MTRHLLIALSLAVFAVPVYAAKPKARAVVCTDISHTFLAIAIEKTEKTKLSKDILAKHAWQRLTASQEVRTLYDAAIHAGFTYQWTPTDTSDTMLSQGYNACMAPGGVTEDIGPASRKAQALHDANVTRKAAAPEAQSVQAPVVATTYGEWLNHCTAVGMYVHLHAMLRDVGGSPAEALANFYESFGDGPNTQFLSAFLLEMYTKSYWTPSESRRQVETRCMAQLPR